MHADLAAALKARIRALSTPLTPRPTGHRPRWTPLPGIRALLFDIYGTLVISASGDIGLAGEQDETRAFREALAAAGISPPRKATPARLKEAIRRFHRRRQAAGVAFPEVDILAIWRETLSLEEADSPPEDQLARLAVEYECRVNPVWPMPGLPELLDAAAACGLVLGLVSNAQFYTPLMLEAFLGKTLEEAGFDPACCLFSYRLLEAKPSLRLYEQALSALARDWNIAPREVLYLGNDQRNDIWPAARLGSKTVLFAGDSRSLRLRQDDPDCAGVLPDGIITDLSQLLSGRTMVL